MSHKILEGKKGIIFGALDNQSIAWKTAEAVKEAGGEFVLTNAPVALRMGAINDLAEKTGSKLSCRCHKNGRFGKSHRSIRISFSREVRLYFTFHWDVRKCQKRPKLHRLKL